MAQAPENERLAAWRALLEAHAMLVGALEAELQAAQQLPLTWYDVLVQLAEAPERSLRMQELAGAVLLSKSGLTRLISRMEQAGMVERRPCLTDLRGTIAALTPAGSAALRRARPVHLRGIAEHFSRHLTDAEAATLRTAFARILAAAGRVRELGTGLPGGQPGNREQ